MPRISDWKSTIQESLQVFQTELAQAPKTLQHELSERRKAGWLRTARSCGNLVGMVLFEMISLTLCVVLYPLAVLPLGATPNGSKQKNRPILLVHGYLHNHSGWLFIRHRLKKSGFGPIYTLNLGHPLRGIEDYGEYVRKKVEDIRKQTGGINPVLIGHSMGGVVTTYYNEFVATSETACHVITIGSPLSGTHVAHVGFGACAEQMQWNSPFIQDLTARVEANRHGVHYHHIASKVDQFIIPFHSAILGKNPERELILPDHGHLSLLFSSRVSGQLRRWIRAIPRDGNPGHTGTDFPDPDIGCGMQ